jgi:hypothetical protein
MTAQPTEHHVGGSRSHGWHKETSLSSVILVRFDVKMCRVLHGPMFEADAWTVRTRRVKALKLEAWDTAPGTDRCSCTLASMLMTCQGNVCG